MLLLLSAVTLLWLAVATTLGAACIAAARADRATAGGREASVHGRPALRLISARFGHAS